MINHRNDSTNNGCISDTIFSSNTAQIIRKTIWRSPLKLS